MAPRVHFVREELISRLRAVANDSICPPFGLFCCLWHGLRITGEMALFWKLRFARPGALYAQLIIGVAPLLIAFQPYKVFNIQFPAFECLIADVSPDDGALHFGVLA